MMRKLLLSAVLAVAASGVTSQGQTRQVDWRAARAETLQHFRALVQIDSSNPPGNERKVIEYLKAVFDREGIPSQTFALDPNRPNLVARLKGLSLAAA